MAWIGGNYMEQGGSQEIQRTPVDSQEEDMPSLDLSSLFSSGTQSQQTVPQKEKGFRGQSMNSRGGFNYRKVGG